MTTYQKYLLALGSYTLLTLVGVSFINGYMDPANIYHTNIESHTNRSPSTYASQLLESENGLLWPNDSWNERDIKSSLAENSVNIDCAVLGSSQAMQISSFRKNASLKRLCNSIINLGVSGGTFEDYLAMSYELIQKKHKPNTIVFSIAPWSLDFHRDSRWDRYKNSYFLMKKMLLSDDTDFNEDGVSRNKYLINLINPSYFIRSINQVGKSAIEIKQAPIFNHSKGFDTPVFLPDGSHIYSKAHISNSVPLNIPVGGSSYKIKPGPQFSEHAISLFEKLITRLHQEGINTILVMTPYHHNVWADSKSITVNALMEVEPRIRKLGRKLNITVLGSYNPDAVGCKPDEFFDFMHAKDSCLSKIDRITF